jgi:hypothetical protein
VIFTRSEQTRVVEHGEEPRAASMLVPKPLDHRCELALATHAA